MSNKDELGKYIYRKLLNAMSIIFGTKRAKIFDARVRFKRKLNLTTPLTLAEKVSWIELNTERVVAAKLTDKYAVRSYIEDKGLSETLIPIVGGPWSDANQIDVRKLPNQFVLKATHGCEMNIICKDKSKLDERQMRKTAQKWLDEDYSRACIEPHYQLIPHRLYAEQYIGGLGDVIDYKFHCINGEPTFVLVCSERESSLKLNLYDLNWNPIEGIRGNKRNDKGIPRPSCLNEMIEIAHKLSSEFDFVRVDLYESNEKVFFGELTFSPASGVFPNFTDEFITYWGERLVIQP